MLLKIVSAVFAPSEALIVSLRERGPLAEEFEVAGSQVVSLGMQPSRPGPLDVVRLRRTVRAFEPQVVQGWMYHGNLGAVAAQRIGGTKLPILWSIRTSFSGETGGNALTAHIIRLSAHLSRIPRRIIYNSRSGAQQHEALGYDSRRTVILPNGFDTARFRPDAVVRARERARLGIEESTVVVGLVARYHPVKDHATFLNAAALVRQRYPDVCFVLVGKGLDTNVGDFAVQLARHGFVESGHIRVLAEMPDVAAITSAFDIACSSSRLEAFPNVLGEAMASGVPCVATNVGDSAWIVGDTGRIVPPSNPEAFASAICHLIEVGKAGRDALGVSARARVVREFSLADVADRYAALLRDAL